MNTLEEKIFRLKTLLKKVLEVLYNTDTENFDNQIKIAQNAISDINSLRIELKNEYEVTILRKFDPELLFLTKQIKLSFDNVSRKIKNEADKVSKELRDLQNSKKLTSYNR